MLYEKIINVAVSTYAFLSSPIHASTYYLSTNPSIGYYQCPLNTTSCHIYCDVEEHLNINTFHCNNALNCYFHCNHRKCGESAVINATNSNNLTITQDSAGEQCLVLANIYAPNYGSVYMSTSSKAGFKSMNVTAGSHTNSIIIDGTGALTGKGANYKEMNVFGATADYVRINIAPGLKWDTATLQCPIDSNYKGPDPAPCMIDVTDASMDLINIIAPYGTPRNVIIEDGCSECTNIQLQCDVVDSLNGATESNLSPYPFDTVSNCWWTKEPTIYPTIDPTIYPTISPTRDGTRVPTRTTIYPTTDPTIDPTTDPTIDPTMDLTTDPTMDPTFDPTNDPTFDPTNDPTFDPTIHPTFNSTEASTETHVPTISPSADTNTLYVDHTTSPSGSISTDVEHSIDDVDNNGFISVTQSMMIILIGIALIVLSVCILAGLYICSKRTRKRKRSVRHLARIESGISTGMTEPDDGGEAVDSIAAEDHVALQEGYEDDMKVGTVDNVKDKGAFSTPKGAFAVHLNELHNAQSKLKKVTLNPEKKADDNLLSPQGQGGATFAPKTNKMIRGVLDIGNKSLLDRNDAFPMSTFAIADDVQLPAEVFSVVPVVPMFQPPPTQPAFINNPALGNAMKSEGVIKIKVSSEKKEESGTDTDTLESDDLWDDNVTTTGGKDMKQEEDEKKENEEDEKEEEYEDKRDDNVEKEDNLYDMAMAHMGVTPSGAKHKEKIQKRMDGVEEVRMWMENAVNLSEYTELLIMHGYDDVNSLMEITMDDLEEMGIHKIGHRRKIFKYTSKLNEYNK